MASEPRLWAQLSGRDRRLCPNFEIAIGSLRMIPHVKCVASLFCEIVMTENYPSFPRPFRAHECALPQEECPSRRTEECPVQDKFQATSMWGRCVGPSYTVLHRPTQWRIWALTNQIVHEIGKWSCLATHVWPIIIVITSIHHHPHHRHPHRNDKISVVQVQTHFRNTSQTLQFTSGLQ